MRRLTVFNNITLDGYFTDRNNDMSWAHTQDPEWLQFIEDNSKQDSVLMFGRKTYDMMASFWPTDAAIKDMPVVAKKMNESQKVVFSRTMSKAGWQNTLVIKNNITEAVKKIKSEPGADIVIFGSGTIVEQLTDARLIDEYHIVIHPIVLGSGRTMFDGIKNRLNIKRTGTRNFNNGNVLLKYELAE